MIGTQIEEQHPLNRGGRATIAACDE